MAGFVLVAVFNLLLGAAGMCLFQRWRSRQPVAAASPVVADQLTPTAEVPEPPSQQPTGWLTNLMQQVQGDLSRHVFEVDQIAEELGGISPHDSESVLAAAAAMLVANRRLQADLEVAHDEIQQQRKKVDALAAESRTDPLTGLVNRRGFDEDLARRLDQWQRHKVPVSLLLVDIDRFKQINDRYGHPVGDAALQWVAGLHARSFRGMDVAARYGGEEFAVVLPGIRLSDAARVAERLRGTVAGQEFRQLEQAIPVTVSIGVATTLPGDDRAALIKRADEALYAAKQNGRDRAFVHTGSAAIAVEVDQSLVRYSFDTVQQVAKYVGGAKIPPPTAFTPMRASDISAKGISFLCDSPPEDRAFVVRLGPAHRPHYMVANVANVTPLSKQEPVQYCVGCAFVARLDADEEPDESEAAAHVPLAELAVC